MTKGMLTSLSHAKTLLVLRSALPVSLSPNNVPPGQLREPSSDKQRGTVAGLLLYATGNGDVRYDPNVTGKGGKNEN